ncbi:MAG: single-stranded DNA-binding protein [Clostridia bacterium]|nr:single-stranded DNA-binding protein [Clostridia bacterium]
MNKVILIGNLARDPELSETPNGIAVCRLTVAVSRSYGNSEADFFNVTVWRERAETCAKYLSKGSKVGIVGSLQNRSYEDKDGVKRYATDIVANEVEFLSQKSSNNDEKFEADSAPTKTVRPTLEPIDDDKLPF